MSRKGSQKFAVLLCKFSDNSTVEPQNKAFFEDLFVNRGTGGVNDYWITNSNGNINLDGTVIFNWKNLNTKHDDYVSTHPTRWNKVSGAIDAFGLDTSKYAGVVAVFNTSVSDAGTEGGVLAGPTELNVTWLGHETGHVLGLSHSFDESDRKLISWSAPGEYYDNYDIMSAMNVFTTPHPKFTNTGPRLCTANQDFMGWLPSTRVWSPPEHRSSLTDVDLVALSHSDTPGYICAKVGGFYLEFRVRDGLDAGIPGPAVLIHTLNGPNAMIMARNAATYDNDFQVGNSYGASPPFINITGGTRIEILSFNIPAHKARVRIQVQMSRPIFGGLGGTGGTVIGGVTVDGGGWIIVGGKVIRIPPRSPVLGVLAKLALVSQALETLGGSARNAVSAEIWKDVEAAAKLARGGKLALEEEAK